METGDRFQTDDMGEFIAVVTMNDGSEITIEAEDQAEAETICKDAIADPDVRKAFSATRT